MSSPDQSWTMPKPNLGDMILFSKDARTFDSPSVGVVTGVGDSTITVSVITYAGMMWHASVHHRADPALNEDHGWQDLGVWDFTDMTKALYAVAASKNTADQPAKAK